MENFTLILTDFEKEICPSSSVFAENLQTVLDISDLEAKNIVENLPYDMNSKMSKGDATKLAELLKAFGAVVILQDDSLPKATFKTEEDLQTELTIEDEIEDISDKEDSLFGATNISAISFDLEEEEEETNDLEILDFNDSLLETPIQKPIELDSISFDSEEENLSIPSPEIPPQISVPKEENNLVIQHKAEEIAPSIEEIKEIEPLLPETSPFLEKKREINKNHTKFIAPSMLALVAILGAVFMLSPNQKKTNSLNIDVNPDLVKSLLEHGEGANSKPSVAKVYSNFEGKFESDAIKIEVKINKANDEIQELKVSGNSLKDKLTTAEEFISKEFYPHLNSLEIQMNDAIGNEVDGWKSYKSSARVFYMLKNVSTKGAIDIYLNLKKDNTELILSSSPNIDKDISTDNNPQLLIAPDGHVEFKPFSIKMPINSLILAIPKRNVISPTELVDNSEPKKKVKSKKNKPVDE